MRKSAQSFTGSATWLSELSARARLLVLAHIEISKNENRFARFCNVSDPRCANLHTALQGAPCSALKLGVLSQNQPEPMPAIATSDSLNQGKSTSKLFWRESEHLEVLDCLASNQEIFV